MKKVATGISGVFLAPNLVTASGLFPSLVNSQYVPIREGEGQIRHGVLTLPQAGYKNSLISFPWLHDVSKNVFYKNGFEAESSSDDLEVFSILIKDSESDTMDAIQVQKKGEEIVILREDKSWELSPSKKEFRQIPGKMLKSIKMEVGNLSGFKQVSRKVTKGTQVYAQLISGEVIINDIKLEAGRGLCLSSMKSLDILPRKKSQIILLYHQG